jgi:hypothetical protein
MLTLPPIPWERTRSKVAPFRLYENGVRRMFRNRNYFSIPRAILMLASAALALTMGLAHHSPRAASMTKAPVHAVADSQWGDSQAGGPSVGG